MDIESNATLDAEAVKQALSHGQQVVLALAPKLTAALSLSGSCIVVAQSLKSLRADRAHKRKKTFLEWIRSIPSRNHESEERSTRVKRPRRGTNERGRRRSISGKLNNKARPRAYKTLVIGMSIVDIITSTAWFFSTWLIPKISEDIANTYNASMYYGAVGNQYTCSAQGFLGTLSMTSVTYNACLALYYFLVIGKSWNEARIQEIHRPFHWVAVGCGLAVSITAACLTMYNPIGWACWIGAYPPGCVETWRAYLTGESPTCLRGDNATILLWAGFYVPIWLAIMFSTISMALVYWSVHKTELKSAQHIFCGEDAVLASNEGIAGRRSSQNRSSYNISSARDIEMGTGPIPQDPVSNSLGIDASLQRRRSSFLLQLIHQSRRSVTRSMSEDIADERMAMAVERRKAEVEHGASSICETTSANAAMVATDMGREIGLSIPKSVKEECSTAEEFNSSGRTHLDASTMPELRRHTSAPSSLENGVQSPKPKRFSLNVHSGPSPKSDENKIKRFTKRTSLRFSGAASVCDSRASAAARRAAACRKTKKVANQAMLYVGALYVTWILPTMYNVVLTSGHMSYALLLLQALLMPTQGLLNFFMYIRPIFLRCQKKFTTLSGCRIFFLLIRGKDEQFMKHLHKEQLKKQRRAQHYRERRLAGSGGHQSRSQRKTAGWRKFVPGVPRTVEKPNGLGRQGSMRSKSSFDPSLSLGGGADSRNGPNKSSGNSSQNSASFRNRRREKLIKKWQRNYNNYPGRHRHGVRSNGQVQAEPEPLNSEEENDLWKCDETSKDIENRRKARPPRLRFSSQADVVPPPPAPLDPP